MNPTTPSLEGAALMARDHLAYTVPALLADFHVVAAPNLAAGQAVLMARDKQIWMGTRAETPVEFAGRWARWYVRSQMAAELEWLGQVPAGPEPQEGELELNAKRRLRDPAAWGDPWSAAS